MNRMKAWNLMNLIPSLTGEMQIPSYPLSRDGELKSKRGSENALSLSTSSTGKPVMTTDFANAMPWFMDTMLPIIATSGSAEGPNEIGGRKNLLFSGVWHLILYPLVAALLKYIDSYTMLVSCIFSCLAAPLFPTPHIDK
uniref:Uncharacterized protein n=1 Tax=Rhinopithecus bieti TaxID=61621 RepID=A0A2K6KZJ1_RHIBE